MSADLTVFARLLAGGRRAEAGAATGAGLAAHGSSYALSGLAVWTDVISSPSGVAV